MSVVLSWWDSGFLTFEGFMNFIAQLFLPLPSRRPGSFFPVENWTLDEIWMHTYSKGRFILQILNEQQGSNIYIDSKQCFCCGGDANID